MTTANTGGTARATRSRTPVQMAALAVGAVFLLVGIAGFIPGVTTNYDQLMGAGHHSGAMLLGIFNVSILHNVVHLLFGVAGVLMSRTAPLARNYLIGGGIIYAVLFVYGLVIDHESAANFVPLNQADNWLHLILAIGMIALGVLLGKQSLTANSSPNALGPNA
jgi:4-hydroxybenzoate polyprenyltransferase